MSLLYSTAKQKASLEANSFPNIKKRWNFKLCSKLQGHCDILAAFPHIGPVHKQITFIPSAFSFQASGIDVDSENLVSMVMWN